MARIKNLVTPLEYNWNLAIERQVGAGWLVRAAYVGSHGTHLRDLVQLNPAVYIPGSSLSPDQRRVFPGYSTIFQTSMDANSEYNSAQLTRAEALQPKRLFARCNAAGELYFFEIHRHRSHWRQCNRSRGFHDSILDARTPQSGPRAIRFQPYAAHGCLLRLAAPQTRPPQPVYARGTRQLGTDGPAECPDRFSIYRAGGTGSVPNGHRPGSRRGSWTHRTGQEHVAARLLASIF